MIIKYPKNETVWIQYCSPDSVPKYFITSKEARDYYYLYEILEDGSVKKIGRSRTPTELEAKYNVDKKIKSALD